VVGNRAYLSTGLFGIQVYDVSNALASPILLATNDWNRSIIFDSMVNDSAGRRRPQIIPWSLSSNSHPPHRGSR
jgi:hypothetical protein